jgi:AcrR family transcriptional regulator
MKRATSQNPAPASRISRRRERTREDLIFAAEGLFAERGVDAVSIDEITQTADVAKGTFYNHFTDKADLARAIARAVRSEIEGEVDSLNAKVTDPAQRVARAVSVFLRFAARQPVRARALLRLFSGTADPESPLNRGVRADVLNGLTEGRFEAPSPEAAILVVIGSGIASIARFVDLGINPSERARRIAGEVICVLLRGLGVRRADALKVSADAVADVFQT